AGCFHAFRPGGHQCAEPQLSRPQRSGTNVSGESVDGGGQRRRRLHRRVRTGERARTRTRSVIGRRASASAFPLYALSRELDTTPDGSFLILSLLLLQPELLHSRGSRGDTVLWLM